MPVYKPASHIKGTCTINDACLDWPWLSLHADEVKTRMRACPCSTDSQLVAKCHRRERPSTESWRSRAAARSRSSDFLRASWLICSCTCAAAWQADYRMLLRKGGARSSPWRMRLAAVRRHAATSRGRTLLQWPSAHDRKLFGRRSAILKSAQSFLWRKHRHMSLMT